MANTIKQTGEKIGLLLLPDSAKPRYEWDEHAGVIIYSLNVSRFIAANNVKGELTGANLGLLLMHEIGHTPAAARTFGYPYSLHLNLQNEFDVVRHVENPYRSYKGMDARKTYGGRIVPGSP